MPRLSQLDDVLFPVEARAVFAGASGDAGGKLLPVPDKKAIVNTQRRRVLRIVSRDYRLVSNREALDWACQCCRKVFPEIKDTEWELKTIDAPSTAGYCFIDLIRQGKIVASGMQQPYLMGVRSAEAMFDHLDGKTPPKQILVPIIVVSQKNLDEVLPTIKQTVFANELKK
jgi:hypothetical protein